MTENSDFLARYMQQDSDDQHRSAPSPMDGLTDEVRLPDPGVADPEPPAMPELRAPEGEYDPNWADKTTTFERVRDVVAPSPPAGGEHTAHQPPEEGAAPGGGDPVEAGAPPGGFSPPGGRVRVSPPQQQPPRHGGPATGGWSVRPPGADAGGRRVQQPPRPLPPRRQFEQRGPLPERAWSPPEVAPAERWAPRADTQVGQPTPTRSVKPEEVSKRRREPAELGWRKAVYMASGGLVNLGAGKHEQTLRDWSALIKSNIPGNYQIAAVSVKGGVGKTRVTAGVGSVFALERGQPVLAIDGNPTYGNLGRYIDSTAWTTLRDFLGSKDQVVDYPTARRFTGRNKQGLEVLAGNQNTSSPMELEDGTFFDTVALTRRFYQLCLLDCGTEVERSFHKAILSVSDALMIVGSCGVDGGIAVEQTVNWLAARGGHELLKRSVIVLNDATNSFEEKFEAHIRETVGKRVRSVHVIPWDPHLRDGADLDYGALRKRTRLAFMELAADLAHGFPTAGALTQ
jgi:MinD-like ATPase involved in chromosome partitioning or flagellar assembly